MLKGTSEHRLFITRAVELKNMGCGKLSGKFGAFCPEGLTSRHVGTLGKFFTHRCL